MEHKINLEEKFKAEICTFDYAVKCLQAGIKPSSYRLSYDSNGELCDGAWIAGIAGGVFYPCIDYVFALSLLSELSIDFNQIEAFQTETSFFIKYQTQKIEKANLVDALLEFWLSNRKA